MSDQPLDSRDELVAAVRVLISEVQGLGKQLSLYAPREEVTRESRRRALRFLAIAVVVVMISQMITMTMISYCFLGAVPTQHVACSIMPGYGQALKQGQVRLDRFGTLLDATESNNRRVEDIDRRLEALEKKEGK